MYGNWQMVSGKIEKGETAWEAALREIKEETDLVPDEFYSADIIERYYEITDNCIHLVPFFIAFVNKDVNVRLNPAEHDEYRWVTIEEARDYLEFRSQVDAIEHIEKYFVNRKPNKFLKIEMY